MTNVVASLQKWSREKDPDLCFQERFENMGSFLYWKAVSFS